MMPKNKDFALRIEIIDECLRNQYRKWTLQKLIDAINDKLKDRYGKSIGKRTIQDDIKYLKFDKMAPIEKRKEGQNTFFYYSDSNYSVKNLPINNEEISYLNDAINILRQVSDFKIIQDVDDIIYKLKSRVDTNIEKGESIIQFEKHTVSQGLNFSDDIFAAIKGKSPIRISYKPFKSEELVNCIFHPYLLKEYRNRWFAIGRKECEKYITNFALDRIKEIKNSNEKFVLNDLFDPKTYFDNLIGVSKPIGEAPQYIEVKVSAKQVPYILTKPVHFSHEVIKTYRNKDVIIRLFLICNYELRSVLLSYIPDIEIIKPVSLRKEMISHLNEAINKY